MARFLCIGDLHGHLPTVPTTHTCDAVLAVGDFCEHSLRETKFEALRRKLSGDPNTWYDLLGRDEALARIEASVESGTRVLAYLNSLNIPVFVVPGNWDWTAESGGWDELSVDRFSAMLSPFRNVTSIDAARVVFEGVSLVGYGIVSEPELPLEKRDSLSAEEWAEHEQEYEHRRERYDALFDESSGPSILVAHAPPYDTGLDRIDRPDSPRHGMHVGSLLVRDLMEKHQPLACICGHMHENPGPITLGTTPVVNLGFGTESWCVFDTDTQRFEGLERITRARE